MANNIADELYSEILKQSNGVLGPKSTADTEHCDSHDSDEGELWHDDGSSWNGSNENLNKTSDLDREWQRRRDQYHTIGYRDGLMVGKEASAQVGFNIGFGESVFAGYKWGLVRGVTSVLACLPDNLPYETRRKLVESEEKRNKLINLHESISALSTPDALKLFHDHLSKKPVNQRDIAESSSQKEERHNQSSNDDLLETYFEDLQSLVLDTTALKVQLKVDR